MAQLVRFLQSRNPAVVVNEGNVGEFVPEGPLDQRPGSPFLVPGVGRGLLRQLLAAGLPGWAGRSGVGVSPTDFVSSSPAVRGRAAAVNRRRMLLGLPAVAPYVDRFAHLNMWQPPVAAPAQVPVATLPEQVPVATLPEPAAVPFAASTPVGPMLYPPQPTSPLFGSQDPRRNLFR